MKLSTAPTQEGHTITNDCRVAAGEATHVANTPRGIFAGIRNVGDGRSGACENAQYRAQEITFSERAEQAKTPRANVVTGIDIDDKPPVKRAAC